MPTKTIYVDKRRDVVPKAEAVYAMEIVTDEDGKIIDYSLSALNP